MGGELEKQVGARVAHYRERLGITQAKLAERVGVASETISRLERGANVPSLGRLAEIAQALGITLAELVDVGRKPPPPEAPPGYGSGPARSPALVALLRDLEGREQEEIALVHDLARKVLEARAYKKAGKPRKR